MEKFGRLTLLFFAVSTFSSGAHASMLDGELSSPGALHPLLTSAKPIIVEFGVEYSHSALPTLRNIVVENASTSSAFTTPQYGNVGGGYPDTFAQTLKIQALLNADSKWTVAFKSYLPLNGMDEFDTGNEYQPEFVLYRAEAQRPRVLVTSGINLSPDWQVGLGLDLSFGVSAQANIFLQSGAGTVSDQRITTKVKPGLVPQASIAFQQYQFIVRGENRADFDLNTTAGARVFGSVSAGVDLGYQSQSALYYQPWEFELRGENALTSAVLLKYGVSYELWGGYPVRAAVIQTDSSSQFSSGANPDYKARNLWVPELGLKYRFGEDALELDYQFKDSIFSGLPTGTGNYLDPPRHDFLLGFTHPTAAGWQWNIHASVSRLTSQTVVKSDPGSIGGPGYTVDGWLYGGGLSVAIPFKD